MRGQEKTDLSKHPNGGFSLATISPVPMILCVANNDLIVASNNVKIVVYIEENIVVWDYVKSLDMILTKISLIFTKNHCISRSL